MYRTHGLHIVPVTWLTLWGSYPINDIATAALADNAHKIKPGVFTHEDNVRLLRAAS